MKCAVVILNWNGASMLRQFLGGVVDSLPEWARVVVVDNGSQDESREVVRREFRGVELICHDKNYGFAEGYNRALELLDDEYVVLLNSDVEVTKGWLEPLIAELESDSRIGAVAPKLLSQRNRDEFEYAGASGGFIDYLGYPFCRGRILKCLERDEGQYDDSRELFWVSGAAFCCRRLSFLEIGGFDGEFFAHMEEIDLSWRMQLAGLSIRVVPQSVVYHVGAATLSVDSPFKTYLNHRNNLAMLYKNAPAMQRVVVAVVRPFTDLAAAMSYLLQGHFGAFSAVWRAWWDFLKWHGRLAKRREEIRKNVVQESKYIYRGSILLRYIFGGRKFGNLM